jgi:transglutaminase-like putative cysteine protease
MASNRRTGAAALAVIASSISLYPIFIGTAWFWAACGSVAVVALTGTLTRLRPLPIALTPAATLVALVLYLNVAFSNTTSLYHLLPTPSSLSALWHIAGQGFSESSRYAPPVPELRGMVLLAAAGVGLSAVLTDFIAVRLESAALAGLPLLLLFTEPFTLSVSRGFLGTTIAFCAGVAGYLTLLSSEARDRIKEWEHPDSAGGDAPDTRPLAATGRRVGFASVAVALCVPLFLPGLHVTRLFGSGQPGIGGSGGHGSAGGGFPDPYTQLSQELHQTQASTVLTYKSSASSPDYLQIYTLDKLTDSGWKLFGRPESVVAVAPRLPAPPGLASTAGASSALTTVTIAGGVSNDYLNALPAPYPATTLRTTGTPRADRSTLMLFDEDVAFAGLTYNVTSLTEDPATVALNDAPAPAAGITGDYLSVPASYDGLRSAAEQVVTQANAKTELQKAVALQDWLSGGSFTYTLNAPSVVNAAGVKNFLATKKGYCQQFSFTMAVFARLLGIPSRVAVGFTSGQQNPTSNVWQVTTHDAHAWPELYFQGYGWLRFEPTPTGGAGQDTAYQPPYSQLGNAPTTSPAKTAPAVAPGGGSASSSAPGQHLKPNQILGNDQTGGGPAAGGGVSPWEVLGLVLAGLVVVLAVTPWSVRRVVRRRRWRERGDGQGPPADRMRARDAARAHAAWLELRDDLTDHGAGSLPSESPRAAAARAGDRLDLGSSARAALARISIAEERARYAPAPADGSRLRADSAEVRRAIAAAVPRATRWRARLVPASVLGPAVNATVAGADRLRGPRVRRPEARPRTGRKEKEQAGTR